MTVTPPPWFSRARVTPFDRVRHQVLDRLDDALRQLLIRRPLEPVAAQDAERRGVQLGGAVDPGPNVLQLLVAFGPGGRQKSFMTAVPEMSSPSRNARCLSRCR